MLNQTTWLASSVYGLFVLRKTTKRYLKLTRDYVELLEKTGKI